MELLRHYLELIKIRMGERLQFGFEVDPALEAAPLAPMLLQPLVENAIKHGLEPKVEGGRVDVRIARESGVANGAGGQMRLTVRDNGLGFGEHADSAGTGVGLANLRERLAVLYDGRATLTVADASPGTEITIRVPM
jgi:hypothetical protein